ncbi:hypothetical protein G7046_g10014 [Stylonectria norvegica]|nr:hypothetical protein G7046_g10014 [Stylonectria norvegica]
MEGLRAAIGAGRCGPQTTQPPASFSGSDLPTVDSVIQEKRKQAPLKIEPLEKKPADSNKPDIQPKAEAESTVVSDGPESPAESEENAGQQAAFNPETGEINWDCPCLGGMADGPCGEDFKTAFSCFVFSEEDPKGMDCIDKFQGMQECFKKYPEIYGAELADAEDTPDFGDDDVAADYQKAQDEQAGGSESKLQAEKLPEVKQEEESSPVGKVTEKVETGVQVVKQEIAEATEKVENKVEEVVKE